MVWRAREHDVNRYWNTPHPLASGFSNADRAWGLKDATVTLGTSQTLRLSFFSAPVPLLVSSLRVISGSTAAGATPSVVRFGLYSVATDGAITLIGATANDTTLLAAANTVYTKALSAVTPVTQGNRYAIGALVVTAAAMPTMVGNTSGNSAEANVLPRVSGLVSSQADLGAIGSTIANASILASASFVHCALLP